MKHEHPRARLHGVITLKVGLNNQRCDTIEPQTLVRVCNAEMEEIQYTVRSDCIICDF